MTLSKKERFRLSEQAALRLLRLQGRDSQAERADFTAWARLSAHHVHEAMFAQAVSTRLDELDRERAIDVEALPDLPELPPSLEEYEPFEPRVRPQHRWKWSMGLAAGLAMAIFLGWLMRSDSGSERELATTIGEQRSVKLDDGSVMVLNTGSRVEVRYTEAARQIRLVDGEALFVVQRDPERPFQVLTDNGSVVALGTQFNVYRLETGTRVSVIEGAVQVSATGVAARRLDAGEEAVIASGKVAKTPKPDVQKAVAWRTRQLVFRDSALGSVAEEFNRYNRVPLRVEGSAVRGRSISGVFDADDVQPLVEFLEGDPQLAVVRGEREIVVTEREANR